jgi:hypothetical protein
VPCKQIRIPWAIARILWAHKYAQVRTSVYVCVYIPLEQYTVFVGLGGKGRVGPLSP